MNTESAIVACTEGDSVRVSRADGTTLQLPAACVVAIDRVLRIALREGASVSVLAVSQADGEGYRAYLDSPKEYTEGRLCVTPWAAVASLADVLEGSR